MEDVLLNRGWLERLAPAGLASMILLSGCWFERPTVVSINGENPPTFRLKGSGYQDFILVRELPPKKIAPLSDEPETDTPALWEIWPSSDTPAKADEWPPFKYGQVPAGFKQTIPTTGSPPPLEEGKTYEAGGSAVNASGGSVWFKIQDGKSIPIRKPSGR